jgi:hypothetical protein
LTFTIQSTVNSGSGNNVSFDLNDLLGTTGNAVAGCSGATQAGTGTLGCGGAGQFVTGIFATYAAQDTGVPEPATLSLVGGSLLALGFAARRRATKRQ